MSHLKCYSILKNNDNLNKIIIVIMIINIYKHFKEK